MRMGSEPPARVETAAGRKGKCSVGAERGPRDIPHSPEIWRLWGQRGKSLLQKSVAELRRELRCHGPDRAWGPIRPNQQSLAQAGALCWSWAQRDGGSKAGAKLWVDCCFLPQGGAFWSQAALPAVWEVGSGDRGTLPSLTPAPHSSRRPYCGSDPTTPAGTTPLSLARSLVSQNCPMQATCVNFALSTHTAICLMVFLKGTLNRCILFI